MYRVAFNFTGMEEDASQLSLGVGDIVRVQCRDPSGWTYGRLEVPAESHSDGWSQRIGAAGWFPDAILCDTLSDGEELEQTSCT